MSVRVSSRVLVAALLVAACASSPDAEPEIPVRIDAAEEIDEGDLLDAAWRELEAFQERGHRAADLSDAAYRMKKHLQLDGYPAAETEFEMLPSEERLAEVVIHVRAGPRAYLGAVRFEGARAFSAERLGRLFEFERTGLFDQGRRLYRASDVDSGVGAVETLYVFSGYHDVEVGPARVEWNAARTAADVVVPISEGPRYTVSAVRIDGVKDDALRRELRQSLAMVGQPYHRRLPYEAASEVRVLLMDRGHQLAEVEPEVEVDREAHTAAITLRVVPGPILRLRGIRVEGNLRTRAGFVESLFPLAPGDVVSEGDVRHGTDRLYGTGVFQFVKADPEPVEPVEPGGAERQADLIVAVEELAARSVEFELGWGSYEAARGGVRYRDRNLFGAARRLDTRVFASTKTFGTEARLTDPYLLGETWLVEVGGSVRDREEPTYTTREAAFDASVRHDLTREIFVQGGYRFQAEDAEEVEGRIRGAEERGFVRSAGPFLKARRDTRDDKLVPTDGTLLEAEVHWSDPAFAADLHFLETSLSGAQYVALDADPVDTVLAYGASGITREILDDRRTLPVQKRLFLGGEATVRSFEESELGPTNRRGEPVGGLTSLLAHVELRRRVWKDFWVAPFYDVGALSPRSYHLADRFGHAVGLGLRYHSPVGPVRLDFAYNPGRRFAASERFQVHLSFGFTF